jgi:O-antigen ligase
VTQTDIGTQKIGLWIAACIVSVALMLTFSRVTLLAFLLLCGVFCFTYLQKKKTRILFLIALFGILCLGYPFLVGRFSDISLFIRDFFLRESLAAVSLMIIQKNPFFGVGINNFFIHELPLQKTLSSIFLQPVHNIYLLVFAETGLMGFLLFIWFLIKTFWRQKKTWEHVSNFERNVIVLLFCALGIGLFDHFFLTLQQGQLMFSFLLGLVWSMKGSDKKELVSG